MRRFDRWLGIPACVVLTGLRRAGDYWSRLQKTPSRPIERILFVKLAEQGATVLADPAIRQAVDLVGRENVYFLVFEENRFILDVMDLIPASNVFTIPTRGMGPLLTGAVRSLVQLRKLEALAAVDFEFFARSSAALSYLSGASVRVGLHRQRDQAPYRGDLMTHRLKYDPQAHTADAYLEMVNRLVGEQLPSPVGQANQGGAQAEATSYVPDAAELARVRALVQQEAGAAEFTPLVLLNANASDLMPLRRWPSAHYVSLAKQLLAASPRLHVAFTGAPNEAPHAARLVAQVDSRRCFSLAGKTTLHELLTLYCLAQVLVTNDSGPAHFASLTGVQVVTLFGPETPARFGARGPNSHIIWKSLPCSPCINAYNNRLTKCTDNQCMKQITTPEVYELTTQVLAGIEPART